MMLSSSLRWGFIRRIGAIKKSSILKPEHGGRPIHHHYTTPGITPGLGYLPSLSPFNKQLLERIGIPFWLTIAAGTGLCIWPNTDASKNNNKTSCAPTHNNNPKKKASQRKKKTGRVLSMAGSKGGHLRKGEEVILDLEDESDRAYHLAYNHGVPLTQAIQFINNCVTYQALSQRVRRQKEKDSTNTEAVAMALVLGNMGSSQSPPSQSTTPLRRSLTSLGKSLTPPGTSITPPRRAAQNSVDETFVATTAAIETLPKWNDCKLVGVAMRKKKRSSGDVSTRDTFANKSVVALSAARYSKALKDATIYYSRIKSGPNAGKKGYGPVSIVEKWNR